MPGTVNFHVVANPARAQEDVAQTTSSKKEQSLISDSLMKALYTEGIPVDVDYLSSKIAELEHREAMGLSVSSSEVQSINAQINRVVQNAKYLKAAEDQAIKNDALADIAVSDKGEIYVITEKGLGKKSLSEFKYGKDQALTVSDLVNYRKNVPSLAFNNDYIQTISTSVGTSKIRDYISSVLSTIGDSTSASDAYVNLGSILGRDAKKMSEAEYKALVGMSQIAQSVGVDAIFKESVKSKDSNMQAAMEYLMKVLPRNMQYQLKAQHVVSGGDFDDANIEDLILSAGRTYTKNTREYGLNYEKGMNDAAGTSKAGSLSHYFNQTVNEKLFDGDLNQTDITLSYGGDATYAVNLKGSVAPSLSTDKNQAVNNLPLITALNLSVGNRVDKAHMFMGNQKLHGEAELANIAYGSDKVAQVWMPVLSNGDIDWEGFKRYAEAEREIKQGNITDVDSKNEIHAALGSFMRYGQDGKIIQTDRVKPYLMTYGYTIDDHIASDNNMVTELTGEEEDAADALIKSIYNKTTGKKTGYSKMPNKQVWDDIYRVPIFMKVSDFAAHDSYVIGGHGSLLSPRSLETDMVQQQIQKEPEVQIQSNSSILYQEE